MRNLRINRPSLWSFVLAIALAGALTLSGCSGSRSAPTPQTSASPSANPIGSEEFCSTKAAAAATAMAAPNEALLISIGYHMTSKSTAYVVNARSCSYIARWAKGSLSVILSNDQLDNNQIRYFGPPRRWVNINSGSLMLKLTVAQRIFDTPCVWRTVGANAKSDNGYSRHVSFTVPTGYGPVKVVAYQSTNNAPTS